MYHLLACSNRSNHTSKTGKWMSISAASLLSDGVHFIASVCMIVCCTHARAFAYRGLCIHAQESCVSVDSVRCDGWWSCNRGRVAAPFDSSVSCVHLSLFPCQSLCCARAYVHAGLWVCVCCFICGCACGCDLSMAVVVSMAVSMSVCTTAAFSEVKELKVARYLLENGAKPSTQDADGWTGILCGTVDTVGLLN